MTRTYRLYSLEYFNIPNDRRRKHKNGSRFPDQNDNTRSLVRKLLWVTGQIKPDLTFDGCQLTASQKESAIDGILKVNKLLAQAKNENVLIQLGFPGSIESFKIVCHNNASSRNLPDSGLQGRFIICLVDEGKDSTLIMWKSKKLRRVAERVIAVKTLIQVEPAEVYFWLANIPRKILEGKPNDEH